MFNVKCLCPYVKGELKENYALNCCISLPRKSLKHHINIPRTALVPQETEESIIN